MLLKDKTVIVTGGSRGIGAGIAIACAWNGADVVINYYGDNDAQYGKRSAVAAVIHEIEGGAFRESGTLVPTLRIRLVKQKALDVLELEPESRRRPHPQMRERPQPALAQMCLAI